MEQELIDQIGRAIAEASKGTETYFGAPMTVLDRAKLDLQDALSLERFHATESGPVTHADLANVAHLLARVAGTAALALAQTTR